LNNGTRRTLPPRRALVPYQMESSGHDGDYQLANKGERVEYHFPATCFSVTNTICEQLDHLDSEWKEWQAEPLCDDELMEAWDVIHSMETYLRIRAREGGDVMAAKAAVIAKNKARGYYFDAKGVEK
jgi:hypothetical protein